MSESEEDRPVVPADMAIEALMKHWPARAAQIRMIYGVDSATFTDSARAVTTSPPALPSQDLLPTLLMQTLIIPESKTAEGTLIQSVI
jgi:hypothetical protein